MTADAKPALPPLPEPAYPTTATGGAFDHQQMRAYARANLDAAIAQARRDALLEAARVCDVTPPHPFRPSIEAARAIRALADKPAGGGEG